MNKELKKNIILWNLDETKAKCIYCHILFPKEEFIGPFVRDVVCDNCYMELYGEHYPNE